MAFFSAWAKDKNKKKIQDIVKDKAISDKNNAESPESELLINHCCAKVQDKVTAIIELKANRKTMSDQLDDSEDKKCIVPQRFVLVIDCSHSMSDAFNDNEDQSKLDKIKLFAHVLVRYMSDDNYLGIVVFGTKARTMLPLCRMSPETRERAISALNEVKLDGVTNLSGGIYMAIDLFHSKVLKGKCFNDNIILFTDGMANEGTIERNKIIEEIHEKIMFLKTDCNFQSDYSLRLTTLGTGGFLPDMIFDIGQAFSSDAFYFLHDNCSMELNLMKPIVTRSMSAVTAVSIQVDSLNGVKLKREEMTNEFEVDKDLSKLCTASYFIHDIAVGLPRHLVFTLDLPKRHKKLLKKNDVLKLNVSFRNKRNVLKSISINVAYNDITLKEKDIDGETFLYMAMHEARISAQKALVKSGSMVQRLDRSGARTVLSDTVTYLQRYAESIVAFLNEEQRVDLCNSIQAIVDNLHQCDAIISNFAVRWDDCWARLMSLSSSLGREVPTTCGLFVDNSVQYSSDEIQKQLRDICKRLIDIYHAKGLNTDIFENYQNVIAELEATLETDENESSSDDEKYYSKSDRFLKKMEEYDFLKQQTHYIELNETDV